MYLVSTCQLLSKYEWYCLTLLRIVVAGVEDVIIYGVPDDPIRKKNRGFAFVEFDSHKNASAAKRRLSNGRRIWGCEIIVDWADPQEEPDDETMNKVSR